MSQEREKAATPTVEPSALKSSLLALDESMLSGYDGDKEDEGESLDMDGKQTETYRIEMLKKSAILLINCFVLQRPINVGSKLV